MNTVVAHDPGAMKTATAGPRLPNRRALAASLVLLIAACLLYLPTVHHPFANLDDQGYVYENPQVQDGLTWTTIKWSIRTFEQHNWHPLTWISHAIDSQLFGIDPAGHHAMNIAFHALDAVVLFWVLLLATGFAGRSFMVAMLFAVHPINVESVAWISERKTLLSTLLFLLALGAYRWYARQPGLIRYTLVAGLFALGLLAKPQIITLPFVLLLWDYWPLQRMFPSARPLNEAQPLAIFPAKSFWALALEKAPLLLLCAASALATVKAQRVGHYPTYSFGIRLGNALVAYVRYIGKALWPSNLAILYPHPGSSLRLWQVAAAALLLIAITVLVMLGRRHRYLPVGWFWFLGTLVPTIGLIQVGRQALADRYAYQSFLGLFILSCWGVSSLLAGRKFAKTLLPAMSVAALLALAIIAHRQIGYWDDNLTLWTHATQVTENNSTAEDTVGGLLAMRGHPEEAMEHYRSAAAMNPNDMESNLVLARYDLGHGLTGEGIERYRRVLTKLDDPLQRAGIYQRLAVAYRELGDAEQSEKCFREAERLRKH